MPAATRNTWIKATAKNLGFEHCGIARAMRLEDDARRLEAWLNQGFHGEMHYMANHVDLRTDPTKLVPGAKTVITLLLNYYPEQRQRADVPQVSKYAYGADYHTIIRNKLNEFLYRLREAYGAVDGRGFVDSAPVLERSWAQRSGLGWVGKHGNLITRSQGSFFFIATLITDLDVAPDDPFAKDFCGSCRRCIDSCPTGAILPNKVVDGSRCISYFTIELKDQLIPQHMAGKFENWMFGCDTCQDVCPWNRFSKPHQHPELMPIPELLHMDTGEWQQLNDEAFRRIFGKSALKRTKLLGLHRNLHFLQNNSFPSPEP